MKAVRSISSRAVAARMLAGCFLLALSFAAGAQTQTSLKRIAFVSHAPNSDVWWTVMRNAIADASADFEVQVDYLNPADGSLSGMAKILDEVAAPHYAGVISTIADLAIVGAPLRKLVEDKKLPLITVNSGTEAQSEKLGALMHIGQPDFVAGKGAGEVMAKKGVRSFICFNHFPANPASTQRCEGFQSGLGNGAHMAVVELTGDASANQAAAAAALRSHTVDALLTLGPTSAHPVLAAMRANKDKVLPLVTFDVSPEILAGIRSGTVVLAVDQQPYLQGYLSVGLMAQALQLPPGSSPTLLKMAVYANPKVHSRMSRYGLSLKRTDGTRHVHSGPGFVTSLNVTKVEQFSGQYR